jgi:hypothetical protein
VFYPLLPEFWSLPLGLNLYLLLVLSAVMVMELVVQ